MNMKKDLIKRLKQEIENNIKDGNTHKSELIRMADACNLPCTTYELAYKSISKTKPDKFNIALANSLYIQAVKNDVLTNALQRELNTLSKTQDKQKQLWDKIDKIQTYIHNNNELDEYTKNLMIEARDKYAYEIIELVNNYSKDDITMLNIHFNTSLADFKTYKTAYRIIYEANHSKYVSIRGCLVRK